MARLAIALAVLLALGLLPVSVAGAHRTPADCGSGTNQGTAQSPPVEPGFVVDHAPQFVLDALRTIPLPEPVREFIDPPSQVCRGR